MEIGKIMNKKIKKALNNQINFELYSSYLYLSMCAWFEAKSLTGFASWMRVQVQEEIIPRHENFQLHS